MKKHIPLSVIILTHNSEDVLEDCMQSVSFVDEIVVVDSGSTDGTLTIANAHHAKVVPNTLTSFSRQRELGRTHASGTWILYIDSDERVSPELARNIKRIVTSYELRVTSLDLITAYRIRRKNYYLGDYEWPGYERLERLFLNAKLKGWHGDIHETADVDGAVGDLDGFLAHFTHRSLSGMLAKTNKWADIESDIIVRSGHPPLVPWRFVRIMGTKFLDSYVTQGGWRLGTAGLVESIFQAYSYFVIYAKVWEKQQSK